MFPSKLYAILDVDAVAARGFDPPAVLEAWLHAGVRLVQLRAKNMRTGPLLALADDLAGRCRAAGARFIVNDRADVAAMAAADGVHVGQDDVMPREARAIVGSAAWVGLSTHTDDQVERACGAPVNYLAFGPVFPTSSKAQPDPVVGLEAIRKAADRAGRAGLPVVAIGGITLSSAPQVLDAGASAVAIISDLLIEPLDARARAYLRALER